MAFVPFVPSSSFIGDDPHLGHGLGPYYKNDVSMIETWYGPHTPTSYHRITSKQELMLQRQKLHASNVCRPQQEQQNVIKIIRPQGAAPA